MNFIIGLIQYIVFQVEAAHSWMVDVLWAELIRGEKETDQLAVFQSFIVFSLIAIFYYYLGLFADSVIIVMEFSILAAQLLNIMSTSLNGHRESASSKALGEIFKQTFHGASMIFFLIVLSNFLPRAGHFMMAMIGPSLGFTVESLQMDLSPSGIWSAFAINFDVVDQIEISILILSLIFSVYVLLMNRTAQEE
ncbi:MAG: hypothetical protein HRU20_04800 [Pseudomonadales bacterium]|nr:hypothetical protein [Pseudomonadales bacterium]